ncbi:hypothetical protein RA19_22855 [Leisingera sp. ANG-M1]|uniref:hypothetical protein n=1 Tax=Leisingera sp. ANG-M1 TaxID=1577895 RepID=UPI00057CC018|nr:hypothetical protein [Leisingera sp. ANG-M1]KIC07640.1 hypothetical protein RA19_22855 [Leisingera sp. ANG-M1]
MTRVSHNPGRVDWSGENPGIYLKRDPGQEQYDTLALFFRVALSPYGRGHAALVLGAPDQAQGWPQVPNLIMTDNQRLMRWIVDGWVAKMPTFIGKPGLQAMTWLDCSSVEKRPGDLKARYSETLRGSGVTVEMVWRDMGPPLPVEVTKENSATKAHEMYSVFLEAKAAEVRINGTALPGQVADRQFFGRTMSTAFLAFSETWVTPQEDALCR